MSRQLAFEWPVGVSYAAADFIPSATNENASQFLSGWPEDTSSSSSVALLWGAKGSGKTHLAQCWRARTAAMIISKDTLGTIPSAQWWEEHNTALLEDIEQITDETALFHLIRHAESHGLSLLLTASLSPTQLPFTLPDLCSRLRAVTAVELLSPDDTLLHLFCLKYCADHQVRVSDEVITYLVKRTERNFSALQSILYTLISTSLQEKHEITIPWIRSTLTVE